MGFPPLRKECAVVCDARPGARSITFHFVMRSSVDVPHTAADDLTLDIVGRKGVTVPLRLASVTVTRRLLIVVVDFAAQVAASVRVDGAYVRIRYRIRNGAETMKALECKIVSVLMLGEGER